MHYASSISTLSMPSLKVARKFARCDKQGKGLITRTDFGEIVKDLDLKLTPAMLKQYIDVNFSFVDRALQGRISFGQFLSCYANFLYSYEISQVRTLRLAAALRISRCIHPKRLQKP
jgi:Ca2+-binding EF-hand superfamily protein